MHQVERPHPKQILIGFNLGQCPTAVFVFRGEDYQQESSGASIKVENNRKHEEDCPRTSNKSGDKIEKIKEEKKSPSPPVIDITDLTDSAEGQLGDLNISLNDSDLENLMDPNTSNMSGISPLKSKPEKSGEDSTNVSPEKEKRCRTQSRVFPSERRSSSSESSSSNSTNQDSETTSSKRSKKKKHASMTVIKFRKQKRSSSLSLSGNKEKRKKEVDINFKSQQIWSPGEGTSRGSSAFKGLFKTLLDSPKKARRTRAYTDLLQQKEMESIDREFEDMFKEQSTSPLTKRKLAFSDEDEINPNIEDQNSNMSYSQLSNKSEDSNLFGMEQC